VGTVYPHAEIAVKIPPLDILIVLSESVDTAVVSAQYVKILGDV
jgi:hypothetical protein